MVSRTALFAAASLLLAAPAFAQTAAAPHDVVVTNGAVTAFDTLTPEQRARLDATMSALSAKIGEQQARLKGMGVVRGVGVQPTPLTPEQRKALDAMIERSDRQRNMGAKLELIAAR